MAPVTIYVEGQSTIHRLAERAAMSVEISEEGPSQEEVSKNVTTTVRNIQATLDELCPRDNSGNISEDAPVSFFAMESLSTYSRMETDHDGKTTGRVYGARTALDIRFRSFARLGPMTTMLSTVPLVAIRGISWKLTEGTEAQLSVQSRKEALQDAIQRATDFADVIQRQSVTPEEIRQGNEPHAMGLMQQTPQRSGGYSSGVGGGLEFEPQKVVISASVRVKFIAE